MRRQKTGLKGNAAAVFLEGMGKDCLWPGLSVRSASKPTFTCTYRSRDFERTTLAVGLTVSLKASEAGERESFLLAGVKPRLAPPTARKARPYTR